MGDIEAAVEAGVKAATRRMNRRWERIEFGNRDMRGVVRGPATAAVEAAAPLIAGPAFERGREAGLQEAREAIKGERLTETDDLDTNLSESARAEDRAYNMALDHALAALGSGEPDGREDDEAHCEALAEALKTVCVHCGKAGSHWDWCRTVEPAVEHPPVVDRDVMREACQSAYRAYDRARLNDAFDEGMVDACVKAAAPVIVKAERDRLREAIKRMQPVSKDPRTVIGMGHALDAVLALLDEEARNE